MTDRLEAYVPRVYRFALRLTGDVDLAEELTQETFLRAWRKRSGLRDPRAVRVWLFRITANLWNDQLRRRRQKVARAGPLVDQLESRLPSPEQTLVEADDLRQALRELNALPDRQREVLYLCAVEGLSLDEAADILDIAKDAVKSSLCQARRKIRERLCHLLGGRQVRESYSPRSSINEEYLNSIQRPWLQ